MATRTCTVVFTDLANYPAPAGQGGRESMHQLVATHKALVTPILSARGGEIIKHLGDSFLVLFPAATDAVRAGIELVEAIDGSDGFRLRVAMATGDIEVIASTFVLSPDDLTVEAAPDANEYLGTGYSETYWNGPIPAVVDLDDDRPS